MKPSNKIGKSYDIGEYFVISTVIVIRFNRPSQCGKCVNKSVDDYSY